MTPNNTLDWLREHARTQGDQTAFWSPDSEWTFSRIQQMSNQIAHCLRDAGIGPGDRVACLSKYTAETSVLWMGAAKVGAVCMPVNWRLAADEVDYILRDGQARVLMADAEFAQTVDTVDTTDLICLATLASFDGFPTLTQWAGQASDSDTGYQPEMSETALQLYSSGTTGLPKGVELTWANFAANLAALPDALNYHGPPSLMLNVLPAFHIAGIGVASVCLSLGARLILYPEFVPSDVLDAIEAHGITHTFLVPAMIQFLLNDPSVNSRDFSRLQHISYGASPITERVLIDGMRVFGCQFTQVYGLTETTGAVTALAPADHQAQGERKPLLRSCGKAMDGVALRIIDPETGQDCDEGSVGEVWIQTEQNMTGYWNNTEATAHALVPSEGRTSAPWFRSGDAGYLRDGYLFMHDRIKDMIISGGENIYPAEVENILMQHPGISDGAIIGVPDEKWGEAVKACVIPRDTASFDADELIQFMRDRLAHFKCPKSVDLVNEIPRNPSGKILKRILRQPYWDDQQRQV